jgi:lysozyme
VELGQPRRRLRSLRFGTGVGSDAVDLKSQLLREEGAESCAYQDSLGYWTIGVGRLIDKKKGGRLTDEEIDYLLLNDIKECTADLDKNLPWWRSLTDARRRVLVNMRFNLGMAGLLGFKNTLKFIETGDYAKAASNMLLSKWAKQVGQRANRLAAMMEKG